MKKYILVILTTILNFVTANGYIGSKSQYPSSGLMEKLDKKEIAQSDFSQNEIIKAESLNKYNVELDEKLKREFITVWINQNLNYEITYAFKVVSVLPNNELNDIYEFLKSNNDEYYKKIIFSAYNDGGKV